MLVLPVVDWAIIGLHSVTRLEELGGRRPVRRELKDAIQGACGLLEKLALHQGSGGKHPNLRGHSILSFFYSVKRLFIA